MPVNHYEWSWGGTLPELLRHSEVKHSLLRDYLVDYFLTLVASPRQDKIQLTVVDGFCGGGRYLSEAGIVMPGSPLVILKAIEAAKTRVMVEQQRRKDIAFDVKLICIDKDKSAVAHLRKVLEEEGYSQHLATGAVQLLVGDFSSKAEAVIAEVQRRSPRSGRSLFVLDQYGYIQVPLPVLSQIFTKLRQAEVILTFNIDSLLNYLNQTNVERFERKTGLLDVVSAADMDKRQRGPGWRVRVQANMYQRLTEGSGATFFTPFFIRPDKGHGDFWLLHLSKHWKARDVMATAHWRHHNHFVHYGAAGFDMFSTGYAARIDDDERQQAAFEFDDAASQASRSAMMGQIPEALSAAPDGVRFKDFFVERVNSTPVTEAMFEKAVLALVREREVEVVGNNGSLRNVRKALQADHVLRLRRQRSLILLPSDFSLA
ncbi:three-Cys-motif partner protein TcmP [Roseateles sp. MS654]|uniref:three-Cys-motif partner protein TcmP n=1 Tax=Roseateles sp. MS654 TaxID=3412685 RepID=UPI003C2D4176